MDARSSLQKVRCVQLPASGALAFALLLILWGVSNIAIAADSPAQANQTMSPQEAVKSQLTALLREFLENAGRGNRAAFEKFFADDVIYTRSSGRVTNKADILRGLERLKPTVESKTEYSAEDIVIHSYGDFAVVAFRLVARTDHKNGKDKIAYYRNTGTFLRRDGVWQVVAWQSTKAAEKIDLSSRYLR